jgi:hypothetical protein
MDKSHDRERRTRNQQSLLLQLSELFNNVIHSCQRIKLCLDRLPLVLVELPQEQEVYMINRNVQVLNLELDRLYDVHWLPLPDLLRIDLRVADQIKNQRRSLGRMWMMTLGRSQRTRP